MRIDFRKCVWISALALASSLALAAEAPPFVTGGVGDDELAAMQAEAANYNLQLLFAEKGSGAYMSGVKVVIRDATGKPLLSTEGAGPWFFARLPAGRYQVSADSDGVVQTRRLAIANEKPAKVYFYWPVSGERR